MPIAKFECSCGDFEVELFPQWAPLGVARFLELVTGGVFNDARFFRVVTKPRPFIVQFGIPADPAVASQWRNNCIADDPVVTSNEAGTLTFATSGPNSRTSQLFLNLADNAFLDRQGFSPIGRIISGMENVRAICDVYGEAPHQGRIQSEGNGYLNQEFPKLDFIRSITVTG